MKIRPFSSPISSISVSPRARGALTGALLLVACSSDEPAVDSPLAPSSPGVFSGGPGAPPTPRAGEASEPPTVGVPLSAPPEEEEPPATETNFKVGRDAGADAAGGASVDPIDAGAGDADADASGGL